MSRLLDFVRPGRKIERASAGKEEMPTDDVREPPLPVPMRALEVRAHGGAVDFPLIVDWLKKCEKHIERGRDNHEYSKLAPMFDANGCTRIDDVPRMTTELIRELAAAAGVIVTIGLVNRVHQYVMEDVAHLKKYGQLV